MADPSKDNRDPLGTAMEWSSRIFAVSLEMVLPGLAGQWLDKRWGTGFLALVGFALGITLAIWHLLVMTKASSGDRQDGDAPRRPK